MRAVPISWQPPRRILQRDFLNTSEPTQEGDRVLGDTLILLTYMHRIDALACLTDRAQSRPPVRIHLAPADSPQCSVLSRESPKKCEFGGHIRFEVHWRELALADKCKFCRFLSVPCDDGDLARSEAFFTQMLGFIKTEEATTIRLRKSGTCSIKKGDSVKKSLWTSALFVHGPRLLPDAGTLCI
jgi:hypothetical protein